MLETGSTPAIIFQASTNGPGWTFWAILLSALIALVAIASQRTIAKRRAAIDLILVSESDVFKAQRAELEDALKAGDGDNILSPKSNKDHERRRCISNVLNHYELVAIAIDHRTVDEEIVKQYSYTVMTSTWDICEPLIAKINTSDRSTAYVNYRKLAAKWKANPNTDFGTFRRIQWMLREIVPW